MKLRTAAFSIVAVVAATPAMAQYWYAPGPYAGPYDRPHRYYAPGPYEQDGIELYQLRDILRAANLHPISRPWRNGPNYLVRALNVRGDVVRVVVDAYRGRIVAVAPIETAPTARLGPDPRGGGTTQEYDANGSPLPPRPMPKAQRPAPEHKRTATVTPTHPPLPRPRPADAPAPVSVKPAPDTPPPPTVTPPAPAPETVPQPTETPKDGGGTTGAAPTGSGSAPSGGGSAPTFPPVTPLE